MNLILFEKPETLAPLPSADPRAKHIRNVLRRKSGDSFDCGLINGPRGKARIQSENSSEILLSFEWEKPPPLLDPIRVLIGLPRPQTARKILREATALGVERLVFFHSTRGEPSYANSSLWSGDEVRRHLINGAEQAFCTRLPAVELVGSLEGAIAVVDSAGNRLALDNYEAASSLAEANLATTKPTTIAIGSERGWIDAERVRLREEGFSMVHLGSRVLRTDTACVAAIALVRAKLGLLG